MDQGNGIPVPQDFVYTIQNNMFLEFTWTYQETEIDGFVISKEGNAGTIQELVFPDTARTWRDNDIINDSIYYYKIRAFKDDIQSDFSHTLIYANIINDFVFVEGGYFLMGDHFEEGHYDELPLHNVYLNGFYIDKNEIINLQIVLVFNWALINDRAIIRDEYLSPVDNESVKMLDLTIPEINITGSGLLVVDSNNSYKPCTSISWFGSVLFCNYLSMMNSREPCYNSEDWSCNFELNGYRLPTEAEWEYAARGGPDNGDNFRYSGCNTETELLQYAWFYLNSAGEKHPTGLKNNNQIGLYDMSGNVWEWCWDWYVSIYYQQSPQYNPHGPVSGFDKLIRGGSWFMSAYGCRVAHRSICDPDICNNFVGFRIVTIEE